MISQEIQADKREANYAKHEGDPTPKNVHRRLKGVMRANHFLPSSPDVEKRTIFSHPLDPICLLLDLIFTIFEKREKFEPETTRNEKAVV